MRRIVTDTSSNSALELLDSTGHVLLRTGRFDAAAGMLPVPAGDSTVVGPLLRRDTTLYYAPAATVRRDGPLLGSVQQIVRANLNQPTRKARTGPAGGAVADCLGN